MMQQLDKLNDDIVDLLKQLKNTPIEDEKSDELVSKLLYSVEARQKLLDELLNMTTNIDRSTLDVQLNLTKEFVIEASEELQRRQQVLHLESQNKRQINVYKSIGAK